MEVVSDHPQEIRTTPTMTKLAYTPKEAAKEAAVTVELIKDMIRTRALPASDAGGEPIVLHRDLEEWVATLPAWDL